MVAPPALNLPVKDQNPLQGSANPNDPKVLWESLQQLRTDLMTLMYQAQAQAGQTIHLSSLSSVACPVAGKVALYASNKVALPADAAQFWTIRGLRQGIQEQSELATNQWTAILAYTEYFLGTFTVGQGDVMSVSLTPNGLPVALVLSDITLRCELTPRDIGNV